MKKNIILYFVLLTIFIGCSADKPTKKGMSGQWTNPDGSSIMLNENGSFKGTDLSVYPFYGNDTIDTFNGKGKWRLIQKKGKWIVDLDFERKSIYKDKIVSINNTLFIVGKGFFGTKRPFSLYIQVGDPDAAERYEFKKKRPLRFTR